MILRFCSEVLEDTLLPVFLHEIPVIDDTVPNGVVHAITVTSARGQRFVADEEVEILDTTLRGKI